MPLDLVGSAVGKEWWENQLGNKRAKDAMKEWEKKHRQVFRRNASSSLLEFSDVLGQLG